MFVYPDGEVSGSINWARLEELAETHSDKSVTADGYAAIHALLSERDGGTDKAPRRRAAKKVAAKKTADPAPEKDPEPPAAPEKKAEPTEALAKK